MVFIKVKDLVNGSIGNPITLVGDKKLKNSSEVKMMLF